MGFFSFIEDAANAVSDIASNTANVVADAATKAANAVADTATSAANTAAAVATDTVAGGVGVSTLSKGVEMYGYAADGFRVELYGRSAGTKDQDADKYQLAADGTWHNQGYEVKNAAFGAYYEGKVGFRLFNAANQEVYERSLRVNANDGDITGEDMTNMLEPSRATGTFCASYGVYNSDGAHVSDLPNRHQVYVSVTQPQRNWQARLFGLHKKQKPQETLHLNHLVLPGSHDAGMFLKLGLPALENMGNTQRDDTYTQLQLGARYFDFRPGYLQPDVMKVVDNTRNADGALGKYLAYVKTLGGAYLGGLLAPFAGTLRHVHLFVPGETYQQFLADIVRFLQENQEEIVVVRLADSGFLDGAVRRPEAHELQAVLDEALRGTSLKTGNKDDLKASVATLLTDNKRLILLHRDAQPDTRSSYSDDYKSYDAEVIMKAVRKLNETSTGDLAKCGLADVQLQLTATGVAGAVVRAVAATSRGTSPLLATKPRTDAQTYAWVRNELGLMGGPLVTVCNDFYDNALTDAVCHANQRRLGLKA